MSHAGPSNIGKIVIIGGFCLIGYMLYALTVSVYQNYQIDKHIQDYEKWNRDLEIENSQKIADFQYFTSDQYREKIAKQSLGLINPGEKVIVLTPADDDSKGENFLDYEARGSLYSERYGDLPNYLKWWKFFFEDNQFRP